MSFVVRDFERPDAGSVNRVALAAFQEYQGEYDEWETMSANIARTSGLANAGELIVAQVDGRVVGAVAYVGPERSKSTKFQPDWPVIRMLVVEPCHRGRGIGRALTEECIRRARRDHSRLVALPHQPHHACRAPHVFTHGLSVRV